MERNADTDYAEGAGDVPAVGQGNLISVAEIIRILVARGLEEENDQVRER